MVKHGSFSDEIEQPWAEVCTALWQRYPNPFSSHVLSEDTMERRVDARGRLVSRRMLTKTNKRPRWMDPWLDKTYGYLVEDSVVDPAAQTMTVVTRNVTLTHLMHVQETAVYRALPNNRTACEKTLHVLSPLWRIGSMVEAFGVKRFEHNSKRQRLGLLHALERLEEARARPSTAAADPTPLWSVPMTTSLTTNEPSGALATAASLFSRARDAVCQGLVRE